MFALVVVLVKPRVTIGLQRVDRCVELLAKRNPTIELVEHGLVQALNDADGLWRTRFGAGVPPTEMTAVAIMGPTHGFFPAAGLERMSGCMIASRNTSGNGRSSRCSSASENWLMRTSLYSQYVPGVCSGRGSLPPNSAFVPAQSWLTDLTLVNMR